MDPLVRLAIGHHHFEAIHPFTDGNGRTGRILNSQTASRYLGELVDMRILSGLAAGKEKLFINPHLLQLLMNDERDPRTERPAAPTA